MIIQQKCAERIYELLPELKELDICVECKKQVIIGGSRVTIKEPIRLADILRAVKGKLLNKESHSNGGVSYDMPSVEYKDTVYSLLLQYNLTTDNLLEQSNEFCEFLLELIK